MSETKPPVAPAKPEDVAEAKELAKHKGLRVLHRQTMTFGRVAEVFVDGCWHAPSENRYIPANAPKPDAPDVNLLTNPVALLDSGDAFWVRPSAFVLLPDPVATVQEAMAAQLTRLVAGFAVTANALGIDERTALVVAKATLAQQLRKLSPADERTDGVVSPIELEGEDDGAD